MPLTMKERLNYEVINLLNITNNSAPTHRKMASFSRQELESAIAGGQSPDNAVREHNEGFLQQKIAENPALGCTQLMELALDGEIRLENRLFTLLLLRKLITMYWSAGFESYQGPPGIGAEGKNFIRDALLRMGLDENQNSRLTAACCYCVVQIAAVDFPDEWPALLETIFDAVVNKRSLSALQLLIDIFDDIVSEEMFFQGSIGWTSIQLVTELLENPDFPLSVKKLAGKLYLNCLGYLQLPAAKATDQLKESLLNHLQKIVDVLISNVRCYQDFDLSDLAVLDLLQVIYECLNTIKTSFPQKTLSESVIHQIMGLVIGGWSRVSYMLEMKGPQYETDTNNSLNSLGRELIITLGSMNTDFFDELQLESVVKSLISSCLLTNDEIETWTADFNSFVNVEECLGGNFRMRNDSEEFLEDLTANNSQRVLEVLLTVFCSLEANDWRKQEAILFLVGAICANDEDVYSPQIINLLIYLNQRLSTSDHGLHALLMSRIFIVLPKILLSSKDRMDDFQGAVNFFVKSPISIACNTEEDLPKIACLMGFTDYCRSSLLTTLPPNEINDVRGQVCQMIEDLGSDSEDDTISVLLEALTKASSLETNDNKNGPFYHSALKLLLHLSAKSPSDVQVVVAAEECLSKILKGASTDVYVEYSKTCIPLFVHTLNRMLQQRVSYSPVACLSLELLKVFMKRKPTDGYVPANISNYILQPLIDVLLASSDDAISQLSSHCLTYLIQNSPTEEIVPHLHSIMSALEKLLSLDTSDSGAMNVGPLTVIVLEKFSDELKELFFRILEAATKRFVDAQNISTSENLIFVFCFLVTKNPSDAIGFLSSFSIGDTNALQAVIPKWLEAFEIVRGNKRINMNIKALSKLFLQADSRLANLMVNGEPLPYSGNLIVTRSMAQKMPQEYTQISANEKMVKLFVAELEFQSKERNMAKYIPTGIGQSEAEAAGGESDGANNEGDSGDWEDVDSILEYEKLQECLEDESDYEGDNWDYDYDDDSYGSSYDGSEPRDLDGDEASKDKTAEPTTRELLTEFFREAASKNISHFQAIYGRLSDHEKRVLSENLV
ncbi:LADA_0G16160g1_1 [Lachancea dasiensis]|uniref:LADA_0G16160g1_1 n=1 Tax=Lachancea dasiensis TaxID=1072105 RepID=A0A1G4JWS4_9SACH|nr:LADA_0G16160g1_1 [Lachancea dasiensis]